LRKQTPNNIVLLCVATLLTFVSCRKQELHLKKTNYMGNLRLDGYYFRKEVFDGQETGVPFFLFKNGIILNIGGFDINNQSQWEQTINGLEIETAQNYKPAWGIFVVEGNIIKFEKWYPNSSRNLPAYVREGTILNDSTFKITESYRLTKRGNKKEREEISEIYRFVQFSPKPDSTNSFIP
jgi:hypothetical protein